MSRWMQLRLRFKPRRFKTMKVAVQGCCHGTIDKIYDHIAHLEQQNKYKVDVLLICGDFQAIRNQADLQCMAVPQKYRELGGFHRYYLGYSKAPVLTIVIGGNHEASNYMWELYHGGWLAPNIYFLGFSGCVQVNGLRIAGASGIYNENHYNFGYNERVPYNNSTIRSIYHTRHYEMYKLSQLTPPDVFLSHDWPNTIERYGNTVDLLRRKPFFTKETETGTLGSPPLLDLLKTIKPRYWFSAHLHTRFEALYKHNSSAANHTETAGNPDEIIIDDDINDVVGDERPMPAAVENPDEIKMDEEEDEGLQSEEAKVPAAQASQALIEGSTRARETRFLALDKCLPKRHFLEVIDIPLPRPQNEKSPPQLTFDPEWLAISRALHPYLSTTRSQRPLPKPAEVRNMVATELSWVQENLPCGGLLPVTDVQRFVCTAPGPSKEQKNQPLLWYTNPQTEAFSEILHIPNKVNPRRVGEGVIPTMHRDANATASGPPIDEKAQGGGNVQPHADPEENAIDHADDHADGNIAVDHGAPRGWSPSRVADM